MIPPASSFTFVFRPCFSLKSCSCSSLTQGLALPRLFVLVSSRCLRSCSCSFLAQGPSLSKLYWAQRQKSITHQNWQTWILVMQLSLDVLQESTFKTNPFEACLACRCGKRKRRKFCESQAEQWTGVFISYNPSGAFAGAIPAFRPLRVLPYSRSPEYVTFCSVSHTHVPMPVSPSGVSWISAFPFRTCRSLDEL